MSLPQAGKFKRTKYFKETGEEVVAYGETKEEARANLKKALEPYRVPYPAGVQLRPGMRRYQPRLVPTNDYVNSPGFTKVDLSNGKVGYRYVQARKAQVVARPSLVAILGGLKRG